MRIAWLLVLSVLCACGASAVATGAAGPGGTIAFTCDGICSVSADGSQLTTIGTGPGSDPVWSPDGRQLAFVSDRDGGDAIYVMDADGRTVRRVSPQGLRAFQPSWSRDGQIAFQGWPANGNPGVFMVGSDGSGFREAFVSTDLYASDPALSPDGSKIAFTGSQNAAITNQHPTDGIYVMRSDGTGVTRVATGDAPAWSLDGTRLASLAVDSTNHEQLVVSAADGSTVKQIAPVDWCVGRSAPAWSPDGATLAYVSCPDPNATSGQLYVVSATGGAPARIAFGAVPAGLDWRPVTPSTGIVLQVRFAQRACSTRPGTATLLVTDAQARPLAAVAVTLRGGAGLHPASGTTNAAGKASVALRTTPGRHRWGRLFLVATAVAKDRPALTHKLTLPACN